MNKWPQRSLRNAEITETQYARQRLKNSNARLGNDLKKNNSNMNQIGLNDREKWMSFAIKCLCDLCALGVLCGYLFCSSSW